MRSIGFLYGYAPGTLSTIHTGLTNLMLLCAKGIIPFIVMRMWFAEMLTDFNALEGAQAGDAKHGNGPALIAAAGNAFTSEYCEVLKADRYLEVPELYLLFLKWLGSHTRSILSHS